LLPFYFCGDFAWRATRPAELIFTESWAKDWPAGFSVFLGLAAGGWLAAAGVACVELETELM
jgi:hypothetical protein